MTISSQTSRIEYTGNSSTTAFSVPFYFAANADIVVYVTSTAGTQTLQVLGTDYTLTGAAVDGGGTCTFVAAPTTGYIIAIYRDPALTQTTSYNNNDPFPAASHEAALDKALTIDQRTRDLVTRAIHLADGETAISTTLAPAAARANTLLGFDADGALSYSLTQATTDEVALIITDLVNTALTTLIPAGTIWPYTLTTAPSGFVFPIGQACTSTYPVYRAALVAASSPFGTNGTDPLMPDLRSAVIAGKSNMGGSSNGLLTGGTVLGAVLGTQTKTLVTANLPAYTPAGTIVSTVTDPGHTHTLGGDNGNLVKVAGSGTQTGGGGFDAIGGTVTIASNTTGITVGSVLTGTAQGGISTPLSVVQPTFVCNVIMKVH